MYNRRERNNDRDRGDYNDEMEASLDRDMGREGRDDKKGGRKYGMKKKKCRFTTGEEDVANVSYKNPRFLSTFLTEHGKIVPRRVTGNAAHIQRLLTQEIKRARILGLLGYTSIGPNSN